MHVLLYVYLLIWDANIPFNFASGTFNWRSSSYYLLGIHFSDLYHLLWIACFIRHYIEQAIWVINCVNIHLHFIGFPAYSLRSRICNKLGKCWVLCRWCREHGSYSHWRRPDLVSSSLIDSPASGQEWTSSSDTGVHWTGPQLLHRQVQASGDCPSFSPKPAWTYIICCTAWEPWARSFTCPGCLWCPARGFYLKSSTELYRRGNLGCPGACFPLSCKLCGTRRLKIL